MSLKNYERQHLAAFAAGYIDKLGTTQVAFGCQMTRIGEGVYAMVLPEDAGLPDSESFTFVTITDDDTPFFKTVQDTSNLVKTIRTFGLNSTAANAGIEVILFRSVSR